MQDDNDDNNSKTMLLHVEVAIQPQCPRPLEELREEWQRFWEGYLESQKSLCAADVLQAPPDLLASYVPDSIVLEPDPPAGTIGDDDNDGKALPSRPPYRSEDYQVLVHVYVLSQEETMVEELEPIEGGGGGGDAEEWTAACDNLTLPHASLQGLWETLYFENPHLPQNLLSYAMSGLLFSDKRVSTHVVHSNRMLLLSGPPGTGKTSLCKALSQKLAIRSMRRLKRATLLEIHSHSLFSKWFSQSGKLIHKLFEFIRNLLLDDPDCLIVVLMDEIESLASSRQSLAGGGEPSDAVRAVNSLLTSLDRLRGFPNVLFLATTNLTNTVDDAFLDRADWKVHIGLPCHQARYEILRSCAHELIRVGIVKADESKETATYDETDDNNSLATTTLLQPFTNVDMSSSTESLTLLRLSRLAEGMSGRSLRKLPLTAHALFVRQDSIAISVTTLLKALEKAIEVELQAHRQINQIVSSNSSMEA